MGSSDSKTIFDQCDKFLNELRNSLEEKEKNLPENLTELQKLNQKINLTIQKIKNELIRLNKEIKTKEEIEGFQYYNGRFQYLLNKSRISSINI